MQIYDAVIRSREEIADGVYVLSFESSDLAGSVKAGQFVNIRVENSTDPLLRRPFSVSCVSGDNLEIIFNIVGRGTRLLASKEKGATLNVLGPLGVPFRTKGEFDTAFLVAGGLGVAPFPFLSEQLIESGKTIETFLGARTAGQLVTKNLVNMHYATDDGSKGFHGTVVSLLEHYLQEHPSGRAKVFGCGPTPMLKGLSEVARNTGLECELSLEGDMACGIGICQGCPVERVGGARTYGLVCTDGPTFYSHEVILR